MKIYNIEDFANYTEINLSNFVLRYGCQYSTYFQLSRGIVLTDLIKWRLEFRIDDIKFIPYTKKDKVFFLETLRILEQNEKITHTHTHTHTH
jgi:hypothetical protein